jgi:hypothetical protein
MFDLEQSIAEWRKQMLAAGIKTPVPLEELEFHLREEIEQQMKSGVNEQRAFEIAAQQTGQASALKNEFKKTIMKTKYVSQRFISSMLVISGVSSLAILLAQFLRPAALDGATLASYFQSGKTPLLDLYVTFGGGTHHSDFMIECLVLSLILTALFALLCFRLSKQSRESRNA